MNYDLKRPCPQCPFLKDGGVRLTKAKARSIAQSQTESQGRTFSCHKTVDYSESSEGRETESTQHCAGALIFAEKHGKANQMTRIMMRLGVYNPDALDKSSFGLVFDSVKQMVEAQHR